MTYLNVWKAWEAAGRSGRWAHRHLINHRTMLRAADIRRQLLQHLWCACCGPRLTLGDTAVPVNGVKGHETLWAPRHE